MYWSPEWIAAPNLGSPWENIALFDFDNEVLESIRVFENNNSIDALPDAITAFSLSPNPFVKQLSLNLRLESSLSMHLEILDIQGRAIQSEPEKRYPPGNHILTFDLDDEPPGIYLLKLTTEGQIFSTKVIKQN